MSTLLATWCGIEEQITALRKEEFEIITNFLDTFKNQFPHIDAKQAELGGERHEGSFLHIRRNLGYRDRIFYRLEHFTGPDRTTARPLDAKELDELLGDETFVSALANVTVLHDVIG